MSTDIYISVAMRPIPVFDGIILFVNMHSAVKFVCVASWYPMLVFKGAGKEKRRSLYVAPHQDMKYSIINFMLLSNYVLHRFFFKQIPLLFFQ